MGYLTAILIAGGLLGGFLALTRLETARGARLFGAQRVRLDATLERFAYIFAHVDFAAFLREESRHLAERVGHDVAHLTLQGVRATERFLTRVVRYFRTKETERTTPARESERPFIETLSQFKEELNATRPEMSELEKRVE